MTQHKLSRLRRRGRLAAAGGATILAVCAGALVPASAFGLNSSTFSDGQVWYVNDAAIPGLDTGSVRNTSSNALGGYGGIRMNVAGSTDRLNGILLRGFGLRYDGRSAFTSTNAVEIDEVAVSRELVLDADGGYGRFFDTFTNTSREPISLEVAFGGELGYATGTNQSAIATTGDGDASVTAADGWASWFTPSSSEPGAASANGPSATVFGTPGYAGGLDRMGDFQQGPFTEPLAESGDDANHPGFVTTLEIAPGQTSSLVHYVVTGLSERSGGVEPGSQVTAVGETAAALAASPDLSGLSAPEVCSIANFDLLSLPGVDPAACEDLAGEPLADLPTGAVAAATPVTTSSYDVVGKTIVDLQADMASGETNATQIVRAYLDRIAAYDQGPLGLHSVLAVAPDAMEQAADADAARAAGDDRPLLGIPILVKDIIDTADMPTTGGSLLFDGYVPETDSWQVQQLREAGAIILGKANLSKFAMSGFYSESDYGQVWNAFDMSKSPIGSSGGSAVSVASSFAAAALGTQTGDSLWGPSGAASLTSLRGTDGIQSSQGTMPLTVVQDYVGFISQSPEDQAILLNAVAREDNPTDALDDVANGHRPADWTEALRADALEGKVIGVPEGAFDDPFGTTSVSDALRAQFATFEAAGATIKEISAEPAAPTRPTTGSTSVEGWEQWLADHPDSPVTDVEQLVSWGFGERMTPEELQAFEDYRAAYRDVLAAWMDAEGVDAVLYATELSDIGLNDANSRSFGRIDPPSSASGAPTAIFPAGANENGSPVGFQLLGREFQDAELLGMAYAFEEVADGRILPTITPALDYDPAAIPTPVEPAPVLPEPEQPIENPQENEGDVSLPGQGAPAGGTPAGGSAGDDAPARDPERHLPVISG
ncbi:amidase [Microbacterium excoecariae]|uniref:amidase n=1 Tax=Microbacterium excoecariae TaxID=2715210 RepID=UPI00140C9594|nr:amidase family protein [Microbacterium excoecariae]NHI17980.1 amidase [Microbacterium excoecariae]